MQETLEWCARNGVIVTINLVADAPFVRAALGVVGSEWPVTGESEEELGAALYAALYSVKTGIEYHSEHGYD